jgi:hypothetical protein
VAGILLAAVLAFAPSLGNDWVYDDAVVVLRHPAVLGGSLIGALVAPFWPPGTTADKLYRPLTTASYHLEVASSGDRLPDAARTHVVNLLLHAATSVGVFLLAGAAGLPAAAAGFAGVLFAVHPVHTEAVVTGYGRAELLAGMAGALLLWLALRVPAERRGWRHVAVLTTLFLVAVMSKEHGLLLWPALLVFDLTGRGRLPDSTRPSRGAWINQTLPRTHVGFAVAATVFLLLRWSVLGGAFRLPDAVMRPWEDPFAGASALTRGLTALRLLWLTGRVLVLPGALCPVWSYPALAPATVVAGDVLAGAVLACAWAFGVVIGLRRGSGSAAIAAALVPLIWIVLHLPPAPHWAFAERWLYLPSVLITVLVAVPLRHLRSLGSFVLAALIAALLIPSTRAYARVFASDLTLTRAAVSRQPNGFHGVRNLALVQLNRRSWGDALATGRVLESRFGPTVDSDWVILNASLGAGDRTAAEAALASLRRRLQGQDSPLLQDLARRIAALPLATARSPDATPDR